MLEWSGRHLYGLEERKYPGYFIRQALVAGKQPKVAIYFCRVLMEITGRGNSNGQDHDLLDLQL